MKLLSYEAHLRLDKGSTITALYVPSSNQLQRWNKTIGGGEIWRDLSWNFCRIEVGSASTDPVNCDKHPSHGGAAAQPLDLQTFGILLRRIEFGNCFPAKGNNYRQH
ncbi:MAG TPA: hypothetical protein VNT76_07995 [Candidatus Binatus sp.]|nr:hypothetical protein [Candidatus Binatus sp.]